MKKRFFNLTEYNDLIKYLKKEHIPFKKYGTENNRYISIRLCDIGNNFYDYGEYRPKHWDFSKHKQLKNNPYIEWVECCDCCCCAGW